MQPLSMEPNQSCKGKPPEGETDDAPYQLPRGGAG